MFGLVFIIIIYIYMPFHRLFYIFDYCQKTEGGQSEEAQAKKKPRVKRKTGTIEGGLIFTINLFRVCGL